MSGEATWRVVTLQVTLTTQETADYLARRTAEEWISSPDSECSAVEVVIVHESELGGSSEQAPDTVSGGSPRLPGSELTLADARAKLSGLHFAKDSLTEDELEILLVAEALVRLLDVEAGGWRVDAAVQR